MHSAIAWEKLLAALDITQDGNLTVFISNADQEAVYFDLLELQIERNPEAIVVQEHHYYPFGMNMKGLEKDNGLAYQFNGMNEREKAFGLELYETPFRGYDPQLGRFWQVEPLADSYVGVNVYQFALNNPVSLNDPMGLDPQDGNIDDFCGVCGTGGGFHNGRCSGGDRYRPRNEVPQGWDLQAAYYGMMGGKFRESVMQSPEHRILNPQQARRATITIVNLNNDANLLAAKGILQDTFTKLRMQVDINVVSSATGLTSQDATGINAVYLFGDTGDQLQAKAMTDAVLNFNISSRLANSVTSLDLYNPETASGWQFVRSYENNATSKLYKTYNQMRARAFEAENIGNIAVTSITSYAAHYDEIVNPSMSKAEFYALLILHVMGHNAGLADPNNADHITSPMASGARFQYMLRQKQIFSYDKVIFGQNQDVRILRAILIHTHGMEILIILLFY